jgi:DNA-directed RNA polymerase subunit N
MIIPVRCFTCGRVVGSSYEEYKRRVGAGEDAKAVMDSLGLKRICCRRMILAHVEAIDEIIPFG